MRANVGSIDRMLRAIAGLVLVVLAFVPALPLAASSLLQWGTVLLGVVLVGTALVRFCPIYAVLRLSTHKVSN